MERRTLLKIAAFSPFIPLFLACTNQNTETETNLDQEGFNREFDRFLQKAVEKDIGLTKIEGIPYKFHFYYEAENARGILIFGKGVRPIDGFKFPDSKPEDAFGIKDSTARTIVKVEFNKNGKDLYTSVISSWNNQPLRDIIGSRDIPQSEYANILSFVKSAYQRKLN